MVGKYDLLNRAGRITCFFGHVVEGNRGIPYCYDVTERGLVIGGRVLHKGQDWRRLLLAVFSLVLSVNMPITRGYQTILKEVDDYLERLSDEWERVQFKKRRGKKQMVKDLMKKRMDLILKVIQKL